MATFHQENFRFFDFPREIRDEVYRYAFGTTRIRCSCPYTTFSVGFYASTPLHPRYNDPGIVSTTSAKKSLPRWLIANRQLMVEGMTAFYDEAVVSQFLYQSTGRSNTLIKLERARHWELPPIDISRAYSWNSPFFWLMQKTRSTPQVVTLRWEIRFKFYGGGRPNVAQEQLESTSYFGFDPSKPHFLFRGIQKVEFDVYTTLQQPRVGMHCGREVYDRAVSIFYAALENHALALVGNERGARVTSSQEVDDLDAKADPHRLDRTIYTPTLSKCKRITAHC
ncbi:hypothetical protein EJ04DRAFT_550642 [Polyplosphaeria fusca]|uniref:Uncharacterized protein n=1 Tax=Polyplosphaeria fusca TaxID=682080 RepID=A0A9P4R6A9_9PLEO|nr:hypothetical protein EJ04DRAFT_550642 [Polyplosphaeria fusca]